jgi:hypothetical protein
VSQGTHIHIIVMENVAWLQKGKMSSRFDLKGSWCARPSSSHSHVSPRYRALPHPLIPLDRVSRQVLKDCASTRRKLAAGCKDHDGTLKDLDMAFVVGAPV